MLVPPLPREWQVTWRLVRGLINNILVETLPFQIQGLGILRVEPSSVRNDIPKTREDLRLWFSTLQKTCASMTAHSV